MVKKEEWWSDIAATAEAAMFLIFVIDVFTALLKAVSFIDLNPLGACAAEKQQSDRKLFKSENKQSVIMRWQPK